MPQARHRVARSATAEHRRARSATDASELVAVEQVRLAVLAERQQQRGLAIGVVDVDRQRTDAAQVGVGPVERLPVGRREVVARILRALEIETETDDGLAIGPLAGAQRISGRDEQRSAVIADAAGRPDPATDTAGAPGGDSLGIVEIDADDPAAVLPAIAEMTAIGDVK